MNLIDFTKTGGYRFKQFTLRKMQEAYFQILKVFVSFCNIPDTGNYIIAGCTISGANITAGYVYIDGDLCRFEQTAGDVTTKIKKSVVTENLAFKNGTNQPVFRYTSAVVHATEGAALSDFIRVSPVFDANYVHTDNNFTAALLDKLNGIEDGAEKNVQADFHTTNPLLDSYIKNKPDFLTPLKKGFSVLGEIPGQVTVTISFPDVGTSNYMVLWSLVSLGGPDNDNDITAVVANKTSNSFDFFVEEFTTNTQSLKLEYILFPL